MPNRTARHCCLCRLHEIVVFHNLPGRRWPVREGLATYKVTDKAVYITIDDVRSEWLLIPLDDPDDQRRLLSMQLTGAWLSECIEMDISIVSPLAGRVGRYPGANLGGCTWMGLIADTNMPTENTPWHDFMEVHTPPDWQIFIQPGGMSDEAENLEWLVQTPLP